MIKLGDVVFCVDCDLARSQSLKNGSGQTGARTDGSASADALEGGASSGAVSSSGAESPSANGAADADGIAEHPRRMATKRDANGDPLCSACLDERQSRRRAEFLHGDDRRNVVHWQPKGLGENGSLLQAEDLQLALDSALMGAGMGSGEPGVEGEGAAASAPAPRRPRGRIVQSGRLNRRDEGAADADQQSADGGSRNLESGTAPASKAAFVRSLPADMPAKEVVTRARKLGLQITPAYVYVIRSNAVRSEIRAASGNGQANGQLKKHGALEGSNGRNGASSARALAELAAQSAAPTALPADANGDRRRGRRSTAATTDIAVLPLRGLEPEALLSSNAADRRSDEATRELEQRFMWLAIELGFIRTQELIDELRSRLRAALAGERKLMRRSSHVAN